MDQDKDIAFKAASDIPIGHKLAIKPMTTGDTVIKYGVDIGRVVADIAVGEHAPRAQHQDQALVGGDLMAMDLANATFRGYRRENDRVGVRNHVIVLPVDDLSNAACEAVANNIKGAMAIPHPLRPAPVRGGSGAALPAPSSAPARTPTSPRWW